MNNGGDIMKSNYNQLQEDLRLNKVSFEEAIRVLKSFNKQWIYTKLYIFNGPNGNLANHSKFKVKYIEIYEEEILIYGEEDDDRLILPLANLAQTESSEDEDELLFKMKTENSFTEIFIKKYIPKFSNRLNEISESQANLILTEGKTDWKHLENALDFFKEQGKFVDLDIEFFKREENESTGNDVLKKIRDYQTLFKNARPKIFIFDRDDKNINKEFNGKDFLDHGNNVYSLLLPVPVHRESTPLISIEHYYSDDEIKIKDSDGRRLYLASEFDKSTKKHKLMDDVYGLAVNKKTSPIQIVDEKVFLYKDEISDISEVVKKGSSIALSKNAFAENIRKKKSGFEYVSPKEFSLVFNLIGEILDVSKSKEAFKNAREISKGVYIEKINPDFEVLSIHISSKEENINDFKQNNLLILGANLSEDKQDLILEISTKNGGFNIPITITDDLLNFINKKNVNKFNRIELFIYNEQGETASGREIFADEISTTIIIRALHQLNV